MAGAIDILSALLTPIVAIGGIAIAWQQLQINQRRLKHELFDRRWTQFVALNQFIAEIVKSGTTSETDYITYMQSTRGALFLFDEHIESYLHDVGEKGEQLLKLDAMKALPDAKYDQIEPRRLEIMGWFHDQINNTDDKFAPYLRLNG